jgi:hypothetical protein
VGHIFTSINTCLPQSGYCLFGVLKEALGSHTDSFGKMLDVVTRTHNKDDFTTVFRQFYKHRKIASKWETRLKLG